jgi:hypothetical protein
MKKLLLLLFLATVELKSQAMFCDTIKKKDYTEIRLYHRNDGISKDLIKIYADRVEWITYLEKKGKPFLYNNIPLSLDSIVVENDSIKYKSAGKLLYLNPNNPYHARFDNAWSYVFDWVYTKIQTKFPDYYNKYFTKK